MAGRRRSRLAAASDALRRRARDQTASLMQTVVNGAVQVSSVTPASSPRLWGLEVVRDVPYAHQSTSQTLDIIRPRGRTDTLPVIVYVHGGGFHMMSKESHWPITAMLARAGYLVVSVNYRLAPKYTFPVPLADVSTAVVWVLRNIGAYGGDKTRLAYVGDSAGGNLVTALAIAGSFPRDEMYARALYEANPQPKAVISACGILQVSDPDRFGRRQKLPRWVDHYLHVVCGSYLGEQPTAPDGHALSCPLLLLEDMSRHPVRPLPAFHAFCGTKDPLLDDTRRLATALRRRGAQVDAHIYPGGLHVFHVLAFQRIARQSWRRQFRFLAKHLGGDAEPTLDELWSAMPRRASLSSLDTPPNPGKR